MNTDKLKTTLVTFDQLDLTESISVIKVLRTEEKFSYVVTPNVDHLSRLCDKDNAEALLPIYQEADLCLCDSRIVAKLLQLAGHTIKAVVPGSDLTKQLFDTAIISDDKVLVLGGEEDRIQVLRDLHPQLSIQHINPSMGFIDKSEEVDALVAEIAEGQFDYIFLAVGSPRQEVFASMLKKAGLDHGVALCIGASINFLIGVEKRAPKIMQILHIEWLYRMLQDPKRLIKRYSMNAYYLPKIYSSFKRIYSH
ncbi:MAG: WecB/TagA/CpsF family glycosyltransferase [Cellvibrionaceae bacterium]